MAKKKKEDPTWKIMSANTVYSKKSGTRVVKICIEKDKTFQECVDILKKKYPSKILNEKNEITVSGLLYPTTITIK